MLPRPVEDHGRFFIADCDEAICSRPRRQSCNEESPVVLYGAGKHVLLGEMIGQSVKEAVTKALDQQSGMNAQRQSSFLQQGIRYGLGVEELLALYQARYPEVSRDAATLRRGLQRLATDSHLSASVASILHLVDQWRWGLISWASLIDLSQYTLSYIAQRYRLDSCELSIQSRRGYSI